MLFYFYTPANSYLGEFIPNVLPLSKCMILFRFYRMVHFIGTVSNTANNNKKKYSEINLKF